MNKVMNYFRNKAAFTLIELIVVAAILAIIAGVAIPTFIGFQDKARESVFITNLDSVTQVFQIYKTQDELPKPKDINPRITLRDKLIEEYSEAYENLINHSTRIIHSGQSTGNAAICIAERTTTKMKSVNLRTDFPFTGTNPNRLNGTIIVTICEDGYLLYVLYKGTYKNLMYVTY